MDVYTTFPENLIFKDIIAPINLTTTLFNIYGYIAYINWSYWLRV